MFCVSEKQGPRLSLISSDQQLMNTSMSHDYAGQQFAFANIVRAIGQPFTIIPLSSLATTLLDPRYDCATRRRGTGLVMSKDHDQKVWERTELPFPSIVAYGDVDGGICSR